MRGLNDENRNMDEPHTDYIGEGSEAELQRLQKTAQLQACGRQGEGYYAVQFRRKVNHTAEGTEQQLHTRRV